MGVYPRSPQIERSELVMRGTIAALLIGGGLLAVTLAGRATVHHWQDVQREASKETLWGTAYAMYKHDSGFHVVDRNGNHTGRTVRLAHSLPFEYFDLQEQTDELSPSASLLLKIHGTVNNDVDGGEYTVDYRVLYVSPCEASMRGGIMEAFDAKQVEFD